MNRKASDYLFTTEGHIVKIDSKFRGSWTDHFDWIHNSDEASCARNGSRNPQHCSSSDCSMVHTVHYWINCLLEIML